MAQAHAHFERAVEVNPRSVMARLNLAGTTMQRGDVTGALAHARRATELAPGDPRTRRNALLPGLAGRCDEAERRLGAVLAREPRDLESRARRAAALARLGRREEAERQLAEVLARAPGHPLANKVRKSLRTTP